MFSNLHKNDTSFLERMKCPLPKSMTYTNWYNTRISQYCGGRNSSMSFFAICNSDYDIAHLHKTWRDAIWSVKVLSSSKSRFQIGIATKRGNLPVFHFHLQSWGSQQQRFDSWHVALAAKNIMVNPHTRWHECFGKCKKIISFLGNEGVWNILQKLRARMWAWFHWVHVQGPPTCYSSAHKEAMSV